MAITGLLIHTQSAHVSRVAEDLTALPGLSVYGVHEDQYVVAVAELPSSELEANEKRIKALEGVLTVYTTYLTIEDELESAPDLGSGAP